MSKKIADMNTIHKRIIAPEMDEIDITGKLLEQHLKGAHYDEKTKALFLPDETIDALKKKEYDDIIREGI